MIVSKELMRFVLFVVNLKEIHNFLHGASQAQEINSQAVSKSLNKSFVSTEIELMPLKNL